jgi:hypothetical protein
VETLYTEDEFKIFVKELFKRQKSPYLFVSEFIKEIFNRNYSDWNFILSKEELKNCKLDYFKHYTEKITAIDRTFFWIYHYCGYKEWVNVESSNHYAQQDISPSEEAKNIFKECAKRLIENFLKNIITKNADIHEQKLYSITSVVRDVWNGWDNFENFLSEFDEQQVKYMEEFKDFFNKCKEVNFEKYIEYDFNRIDLTDALLFNR